VSLFQAPLLQSSERRKPLLRLCAKFIYGDKNFEFGILRQATSATLGTNQYKFGIWNSPKGLTAVFYGDILAGFKFLAL
jgi:hypothetical protein